MSVSLVPRTVMSLVRPAVYAVASRLFVLTSGRAGSKKHQPTIQTFYETGIVTALYEQLLMSPELAHLEIRHENPYPSTTRPKQVDLWIRPPGGGYPHIIEAGDFSVGKVHRDLRKGKQLNPTGSNWFLAFFREPDIANDPKGVIDGSLGRANGLDATLVGVDGRLIDSFVVYRPTGEHDPFGFALLRAL